MLPRFSITAYGRVCYGPCHTAQEAALLRLVTALVGVPPTYGYRCISAVLNRQLRAGALAPGNRKRVYRIMQDQGLLPVRRYTELLIDAHGREVIA